jgi:ABC-type Fe3+ transport system permease subunit
MAQKYIPPTQGRTGQIFDVVCLLVMVFLVLFLPVWLNIAVPSRVRVLPQGVQLTEAADADGNVTQTWTGLTWEAIGQNPTMQERWQALGYSLEGTADIVTQPFDYTIDIGGIAITGIVILGYFLFVLVMSKREYKDVIAEKFE